MKQHKIYGIENIEGEALAQFYDAMKQDFVVKGALMPDAHAGYSLPIGAVVATDGVVVPAWVGYDIGCGMCAVKTSFVYADVVDNREAIFNQIYRDVPTGFSHNERPNAWLYDSPVSQFVRSEIIAKGAPEKQIGTLGGGNHFIEIGDDADGNVWIVIHSGSRNVGHKIATHYMKLASGGDKAREGHYPLSAESVEGKDYIADLAFGLNFALDNRLSMIKRIEAAMKRHIQGDALSDTLINRNHNHAEFKDGLWIHRKGATHAEAGMMGVIPGNMRDGSFIVKGLGNPDSLYSSSHGAGRVLGRKQAKATLSLDAFKETMQVFDIKARIDESTLDESPMAYKDIFEVMHMQRDLVTVEAHIRPIINVKG